MARHSDTPSRRDGASDPFQSLRWSRSWSQSVDQPQDCLEQFLRHRDLLAGGSRSGFRWQSSLCRRIRDLPAGVGYRNYFPVDIRARSICSQSAVERVIKATSVEFCGFKNCNGKLRTGIRLVARTIAGAPISEAYFCASFLILMVLLHAWRSALVRCGAVLAIHCASSAHTMSGIGQNFNIRSIPLDLFTDAIPSETIFVSSITDWLNAPYSRQRRFFVRPSVYSHPVRRRGWGIMGFLKNNPKQSSRAYPILSDASVFSGSKIGDTFDSCNIAHWRD